MAAMVIAGLVREAVFDTSDTHHASDLLFKLPEAETVVLQSYLQKRPRYH